jgi:hypothetical protein
LAISDISILNFKDFQFVFELTKIRNNAQISDQNGQYMLHQKLLHAPPLAGTKKDQTAFGLFVFNRVLDLSVA